MIVFAVCLNGSLLLLVMIALQVIAILEMMGLRTFSFLEGCHAGFNRSHV